MHYYNINMPFFDTILRLSNHYTTLTNFEQWKGNDNERCGVYQQFLKRANQRKAGQPLPLSGERVTEGGKGSRRQRNPGKGYLLSWSLMLHYWLKMAGWMDGWMGGRGRSRDAILICAIIMCTHSPGGWYGGGEVVVPATPLLRNRPAFLCLPPESEGNRVIEELIRTRPVL